MQKNFKDISIDPAIRFGKPCITGTRITVGDILGWLAAGMSIKEIIADFPELSEHSIYTALAYAADRENKVRIIAA